jgi:hypothetical protein
MKKIQTLFEPLANIPFRKINVSQLDPHSQERSPFFKLSRKLRDEIYAYYTYEPEGYRYVFRGSGPGELRLSIGTPIYLPLKTTCKKIANELGGIALQPNTIHFFPSDRVSDSVMRSDALQLKRLSEYANVTKWRMLFLCDQECMSDAIVEQVQRKYPEYQFIEGYKLGLDEYINSH